LDKVSPKVKVLYFDHTAKLGGGERSLLGLLENLNTSRYDPLLVTPVNGPLVDAAARIGVKWKYLDVNGELLRRRRRSIGTFSGKFITDVTTTAAAAIRLHTLITEEEVDIVHSNSQKAHFIAALAASWSGTPLVWHARDIFSDRRISAMADVVAGAFSETVIAISEAVAEQFRIARPRVRVVYNGIDVTGFARRVDAADAAAVREKLGAPPGAGLIVNVGQLSRWKGQDVFLRVAGALAKERQDLRFAVVGDPMFGENGYGAFLRKLAADLGVSSRVTFAGAVEDVSEVFAAADIMLHTPVEPEPFGRVIVEAMAAGVPVVAARCGGIPEIVNDGVDGVLFPPRDVGAAAAAVRKLVDDSRRTEELAEAGRRRAKDFDIYRTVGTVEEIYEEFATRERTLREKTAFPYAFLPDVSYGGFEYRETG